MKLSFQLEEIAFHITFPSVVWTNFSHRDIKTEMNVIDVFVECGIKKIILESKQIFRNEAAEEICTWTEPD